MILGSKGQGSEAQGHHFQFLAPLYICGVGVAEKFKFCVHMHYGRLLPVDHKLCQNAEGVTEYSCEKFPQLHNALSNKICSDISMTLPTTVGR